MSRDPVDDLVDVHLLNFPLRLFRRAREHHDEVMRECALLAFAETTGQNEQQVPRRLAELIDILGRDYGAAREQSEAVREAALERGDVKVDLHYRLPRDAAVQIRALNGLLHEADEFCRAELLLSMPSSDLVVSFRSWYLSEFERQLQGHEPRPWDGPLDP